MVLQQQEIILSCNQKKMSQRNEFIWNMSFGCAIIFLVINNKGHACFFSQNPALQRIVVTWKPKHSVINVTLLGPSGWRQDTLAAHLQRQFQMTVVPRRYSSAVLRDLLSWGGTRPQGSVAAPVKRLSGVL